MTIIKFADSHPSTLFKADMRSAASITDFSFGTTNGTLTFTDSGMDTAAGGSAQFTDFPGEDVLATTGQISMTVTTNSIAVRDNLSIVNGSLGVARIDIGYLMRAQTQSGTNTGQINHSTANIISFKSAQETATADRIQSVGKGETSIVTMGWDATTTTFYVDGAEIGTTVRGTVAVDTFFRLFIGASINGTSSPFANGTDEAYISDLIVSTLTPNVQVNTSKNISLFGDSFPFNLLTTGGTSPFFDASAIFTVMRNEWRLTGKSVLVDGLGNSGATICNTASDNLNDDFPTFLANNTAPTVAIIAGNNDAAAATTAQVNNVTTGVRARLTSWLDQLKTDGRKRVYIYTPANLIWDTALATVANETRRKLVEGIMRDTVNEFITADGTSMQVFVVQLEAVTGSAYLNNLGYQGHQDEIGNIGTGGSVAPGSGFLNRHLSSVGGVMIADDLTSITNALVAASGGGDGLISSFIK